MATTALLGCTGMVGAFILTTLRSSRSVASIDVLARRPPPDSPDSKVKTNAHVDKDTTTWPAHMASLTPAPSILFSALATTRGAAGSFENQYKLEHDLNVELAKKAKESGTKVYVLISSGGANVTSNMAYLRMKGEIEEHVKELGFDCTVIVQPGLITGDREESRPSEAVVRKMATVMGAVSGGLLKDFWAQDADVIARAAVSAGLKALNGEAPGKVWMVHQSDIMRLGKKEWKEI